jgi:hypothetical protein
VTGLLALALVGCRSKAEEKEAMPERDLAVLEKIVRLPMRPLEVWFRSVPRGVGGGPGPTDWTFLAVMRFDRDALASFMRTGGLVEKGEPRFPRAEVAPWFPPEVRAALQPDGESHVRVKGRRFDAAPFALGDAPAGSFFVLEDAPFIVLRRAGP